MKPLIAFSKKERMEQARSGKLIILGILFIIIGIMNPAIAKMTPWLLEMMSESLEEIGMTITQIKVSALDSWQQFYKNIPMGLIAFLLIEGGIFTKEYESGTLLLSLTKGLERYKVAVSKAFVLIALWTVGYWLCFVITYGYNAYFWDNSAARNLILSAVNWWIFGLFILSLTVLFSVLAKSNSAVFGGIGGSVLAMYILSLFPKLKECLPLMLADGNSLIFGLKDVKAYGTAVCITIVLSALCFAASIPIFNKKQL
jgi:ABC-2 type transport system permease protein